MANVDLTELLNRGKGEKTSAKEMAYIFYAFMSRLSISFVWLVCLLLLHAKKPLLPLTENFALYFEESWLAWFLSNISFLNIIGNLLLSIPFIFGYIYVWKNIWPRGYLIYTHGRCLVFFIFDLALIGFAIFMRFHYFSK